mgnify:FL=1
MVLGYLIGQMAEDMKGNILKIRSMEMECLSGQTEEYIKGHGLMEDSMEKGFIIM